jgi:hypothetical protein
VSAVAGARRVCGRPSNAWLQFDESAAIFVVDLQSDVLNPEPLAQQRVSPTGPTYGTPNASKWTFVARYAERAPSNRPRGFSTYRTRTGSCGRDGGTTVPTQEKRR